MNKFSFFYLLSAETILWFLLFFAIKGLKLSDEVKIIVLSVYLVMMIVSLVLAYRSIRSKR